MACLSLVACGGPVSGGGEETESGSFGDTETTMGTPDLPPGECAEVDGVDVGFELDDGGLVATEEELYELECVVEEASEVSGQIALACSGQAVELIVPPGSFAAAYLPQASPVTFRVVRAGDSHWFALLDAAGIVLAGAGGTTHAELLPSHPAVADVLAPAEVRLFEETDCGEFVADDESPDCTIWGRRIALEAHAGGQADWVRVYDETADAVSDLELSVEVEARFTKLCEVSDYARIQMGFLLARE